MLHPTLLFLLIGLTCAYGQENSKQTAEKPRGPATYCVTFSKSGRPGTPLLVNVRLLKLNAKSTVSVSLRNDTDGRTLAEAPQQLVSAGQPVVFNLMIPSGLKNYDSSSGFFNWYTYSVNVVASGDVSFNQSDQINLEEKSLSCFVQTDKAIYQPGQTVNIRALAMKPNLLVANYLFNVTIKDPQNNILQQDRQVQGVDGTGVIQRSLPLADRPPLGTWTIEVETLGCSQTLSFDVQEYVLPTFQADVELPAYTLISDNLEGKVKGKYTYAQPLRDAFVLLTLKFSYFYSSNGSSQPYITRRGQLDSNGEMKFSFTPKEVEDLLFLNSYNYPGATRDSVYLNYQSVQVEANVTERSTGRMMGASASSSYRSEMYKIEILPISASTYNPGQTYNLFMSGKRYDDAVFPDSEKKYVQCNVTYYVPRPTTTSTTTTTAAPPRKDDSSNSNSSQNAVDFMPIRGPWFPWYNPEDEFVLKTMNRTLDSNGFVTCEISSIPPVATKISIQVTFGDTTAYQTVNKAASPSDTYMQIKLNSQNLKVGDTATFSVETTNPAQKLIYEIYSKGSLISSAEVASSDPAGSQNFIISFLLTRFMSPNCRLNVYFFRAADGELVIASLSFKVDAPSSISLKFSKETVKPGESVDLLITAPPDTFVFTRAVDVAVDALKSGNDLTIDRYNEEVLSYDFGSGYFPIWRLMYFCGGYLATSGSDASSILDGAGLKMLTDGMIYQKPYENNGPVFFAMNAAVARGEAAQGAPAPAPQQAQDAEVEKVRKNFVETWLWNVSVPNQTGRITLPLISPDGITTYKATAFGVNNNLGLMVAPEPAEVTVFRNVFLILNIPKYFIRNEIACLQAISWNYFSQTLDFTVTMGRNSDISNIRLVRQADGSRKEERKPMKVIRYIGGVAPNTSAVTSFCFQTTAVGSTVININLTTSIPGDGIEQTVLVKPEGVARNQFTTAILNVKPNQPFSFTTSLVYPEDIVNDSSYLTFYLSGSPLVSVMKNIRQLIRLPTGCGEQNMINFAPLVFSLQYYKAINNTAPEEIGDAQRFLITGYQTELLYRHPDGSYSAFGPANNAVGSTWLTAFVLRCFLNAIPLKIIIIDPDVIRLGIRFLMDQQNKNGSFTERGVVFHKDMQGGSANGQALTGYVICTLLDAKDLSEVFSEKDLNELKNAIAISVLSLEQSLSSLTDQYDIAVVTYALHRAGSSLANQAFNQLEQAAITSQQTKHWERQETKAAPVYPWETRTNSINIEATAYALLTYLLRGDTQSSVPIVRWLVSQQNPNGGFASTQDTVIAIQALALFAAQTYSPVQILINVDFIVTVAGQQKNYSFSINDANKEILQFKGMPIQTGAAPSQVMVVATTPGNQPGIAVASVSLDYNVKNPTTFTAFTIGTPEVTQLGSQCVLLKAKVDLNNGNDDMVIIAVETPTAYSFDWSSGSSSNPAPQMVEEGDSEVRLYYQRLGPEGVQITIQFCIENGIPVEMGEKYIHVYKYYDAGGSQQATRMYSLPGYQNKGVCDKVPDYQTCSSGKPQ